MPPFWFMIIAFLVLLVFFLAWRLVRSRTWKHLQLRKAATMAAAGQTQRMLTYLRRNMNKRDVSDPLTNALVYFHIKAGQYDEAHDIVQTAIDRGGETAVALAQLGYIAGGRGNSQGAEEYYRKALEMDPSLKPTMNMNIAGMLIESGQRLEEAEELLNEALELRDGSARSGIHANLAMLYLKQKKPVEARVQAMTAYELIPSGSELLGTSRANALALASRACIMQGEGEEAAKLAGKGLKMVQDLPGADRLADELRKLISEAKPAQEN